MQSNLRDQDIFEMAFAGIPRVAGLIAALRLEDRARALDAAEQRYKQMARDLGVSEGAAAVWRRVDVSDSIAFGRRNDERQRCSTVVLAR
jgi:hypothetical protein